MLKHVIAQLPDAQRIVISLRDVQDFSAEEVCQLLDISEGNQRVLLHRATLEGARRARGAPQGGGEACKQPPVRCVEFVELVTDWSEGALDESVRAEVEEHINICPPCAEYVEQMRMAVRLLRGAEQEAPPEPARDALLAAFRARLNGDS